MTIVPRIAALFACFIICICAVQPAGAQSTPFPFLLAQTMAISGNGRYLAYTIYDSVTSVGLSVRVYDRHTGQHDRVDVSSAGTAANGYSFCHAISADARFVAFISSAGNLVTGDTNLAYDVFVRDRQTGQTTRESLHANGAQLTFGVDVYACPTISDDGRYVVFRTLDSLVVGDIIDLTMDVYVRDRLLATTSVVSVSSTGQFTTHDNHHPRLSANGRFVTWMSYGADQLVPGYAYRGEYDIFVRDLQASQTTLVSRSTAGAQGNGESWYPTISGDGRHVAFASSASNLVAGDAGGFWDVFLHDRENGETTMASVSSTGAQANNGSEHPSNTSRVSISYDGRYVAFNSDATNLVPMDTNGQDIFVRDLVTQTTSRATLKGDQSEPVPCPTAPTPVSKRPVLSASGIDMVLNTNLPLSGPCDSYALYIRRVWSASAGDFDLDRRADITVFRPSNSTWFTRFPATAGGAAFTWGTTGDIPTAADFDGDGRTDYAVFRPSTGVWYWLHSWTNNTTWSPYPWGTSGDVPAPGDYDGDGKADPAVFRPSTGTWFAKLSGANFTTHLIVQFGASGDVPVPADYDGDRKMDVAVYRPSAGVWYIRHSSTGAVVIRQWGNSTDVTVPGDYDGDALADLAVYRPSTGIWYIAKSTTGFATYDAIQWGVGADVPVAADYDGDGRMDPAVFRPGNSTWWVYNQFALFWGSAGDVPIGGRY